MIVGQNDPLGNVDDNREIKEILGDNIVYYEVIKGAEKDCKGYGHMSLLYA